MFQTTNQILVGYPQNHPFMALVYPHHMQPISGPAAWRSAVLLPIPEAIAGAHAPAAPEGGNMARMPAVAKG